MLCGLIIILVTEFCHWFSLWLENPNHWQIIERYLMLCFHLFPCDTLTYEYMIYSFAQRRRTENLLMIQGPKAMSRQLYFSHLYFPTLQGLCSNQHLAGTQKEINSITFQSEEETMSWYLEICKSVLLQQVGHASNFLECFAKFLTYMRGR